jgi:hypothetical protein
MVVWGCSGHLQVSPTFFPQTFFLFQTFACQILAPRGFAELTRPGPDLLGDRVFGGKFHSDLSEYATCPGLGRRLRLLGLGGI